MDLTSTQAASVHERAAPLAETGAPPPSTPSPLEATLVQLVWERGTGQLRLMEDCCRLLDTEVGARRGLRGATLRAGYTAVQKLKPGIIGYVIGKLAPDCLAALEPQWARARAGCTNPAELPATFQALLVAEGDAVADALVGVTDARIRKARVPIQIAYSALRGEAAGHVRGSVPGFAEMLARHVAERLGVQSVSRSQVESSSRNPASTGRVEK